MAAHSFTTSKSMLMHAALAHISPELTTLNDIIIRGHNPLTVHTLSDTPAPRSIPRLPTEILLIIREWLLPEVTIARQIQSLDALKAYENSLRKLLCEDCILYNLDIYGPNLWDWEQFTSACSCREPGVPKGYRSSCAPSERRAGKLRDGHNSISSTASPPSPDVNPKQFPDAEHWLEWHLSREVALCVGYRGHEASSRLHACSTSDSASEASAISERATPAGDIDIWHVIGAVLREFKCEVAREAEGAMSPHERALRREQRRITGYDHVTIVPVRLQEDSSPKEEPDSAAEWDTQRRLHRAYMELGQWSTCPDVFSEYLRHTPAPSSSCRPPRDLEFGWWNAYLGRHQFAMGDSESLIHTLQRCFKVILVIAAGFVAAPLTFTTFALTMLCYYSRPKSFRLL